MRKITQRVIGAFLAGRSVRMQNSSTDGRRLFLHGNLIAKKTEDGKIAVTLAGWPTPTTRERLNGLPGVNVHQKDHEQYLNGKPWDGEWTVIGSEPEQ